MNEIELIPEQLAEEDNTENVLMTKGEIWFLKHFIKKYHPKKIVEVGFFAGGNTVNLLKWKDEDAQLFSIDIATHWHKDITKLSGWMADEIKEKKNFKIYRGYDYLDIYEEIGKDIDLIIIDTVHTMPGEFFTFLAALPQLKDGCVVILHDIHLNMISFIIDKYTPYNINAYCTGLLYGGVNSNIKWTVKSDSITNIGAFIIDKSTRNNIKDIFHILTTTWHSYPHELNLKEYSKYIDENYPKDCYNLFNTCLELQSTYFNHISKPAQNCRIDIVNSNNEDNSVEILDVQDNVNISFPDWLKTNYGQGLMIETELKSFDLTLKCIGNGRLSMILRGPNVRDHLGNHIPSYVNYYSFKVNGNDLTNKNINVWHDAPYFFEKNVENGEIIHISVNWKN